MIASSLILRYDKREGDVMNFAQKLQMLRTERHMSQETLAEAVGVSRQAISKWESGLANPEMEKIIRLSDLFQVSIDYLVKENETREKEVSPGFESSTERASASAEYGWCFLRKYEYVSKHTLFGLPLVHVHIGRGMPVAKGIVAIGNISVGFLSIGLLSFGGLCIGVLSAGLLCFAAIAAGLLLAVGGLALGALAIGGIAVGVVSLGGLSIGMFSVGGMAVASDFALGGYASGHIAIGNVAKGARTITVASNQFASVKASQVAQLLHQEYPNLWKPLYDWILLFFS